MKNVTLPISNLPIGPVSRTPSPCRGTERGRARTNRKSIVATARFETIESPPSRCVLLRFRETSPASRLNHGSVPRVICSVVELVVLIVARVSKAILTICRERDTISRSRFGGPSITVRRRLVSGGCNIVVSCIAVMSESRLRVLLFLVCCFAEYANAAGEGRS